MNALITLAIKYVLNWAYSLSRTDLTKAIHFVAQAEQKFASSANKKEWVVEQLKKALPAVSGRGINLLIELAVAKIGKK